MNKNRNKMVPAILDYTVGNFSTILQLSIHGMREPFVVTSTLKTILNHGTSNIPNAIRIGGSVALKMTSKIILDSSIYDLIRLMSNPGMNLARG
jgi:hypothetical protein